MTSFSSVAWTEMISSDSDLETLILNCILGFDEKVLNWDSGHFMIFCFNSLTTYLKD